MSLLKTIASKAAAEYTKFLEEHSESVSIGDWILLYGQSDITERNETFEVPTYLPEWFAIGDDGGGTAILMRLDGSAGVFRCGHGALGSIVPEPIDESFANWLAASCPATWLDDDDEFDDDLDDVDLDEADE